jgi:6-phosphogluconolactonase
MTQAAQNITLFDTNQAMTAALIEDARAVLSAAGTCSLLLSGGSSPCDFYTALGQEEINWGNIHIALVDERWVDEDDDGSNAALVKRSLMAGHASQANFLPMKNSAPTPHQAEAELDRQYRRLPKPALSVLGMGPDKHTASWFCEAEEYEIVSSADAPLLIGGLNAPQTPVTGAYLQRMTITGSMLGMSGKAYLIIKGDSKIELLHSCLVAPASASPIGRAAAILGPRLQIFALQGDG